MSGSIFDLIKERTVLLDGGMGTELIRHGFPQGACPESWNVEKSDIVKKIHKSYFDAGSDAVLTNSFGGSKIKLSSYGLENRCHELNHDAAKIANEVKPEGKYVAGSMGPTGKFLEPQGEFTEAEFEDAYAEQAKGLTEGKADFLLIETQYDLREALCALRGARQESELPIFITITFNKGPRGFFTLMGNSVTQCIEELEEENVPVIGTNCTLNSAEMVELIKIFRENTALPLIAQANAGKPSLSIDGKVAYSQELDDYVSFISPMIKSGANLIGGCCGTNPDYIKKMAGIIKKT
ncbi:MAG: homocysteine S-methyltransferase family protein [Candidatus Aminicenantes bacterium]|nr:MAG: homocysteine S-methyltransferase family protein [Candidatus Aminicenantes bacterium]